MITGLVRRRSLYDSRLTWHRVPVVTPLPELRRAAGLSQQACAALVDVPLNTFRMWDSGLRRGGEEGGGRARSGGRGAGRARRRLLVTFSSRSAFGRPIRLATRAAGQAFMRKDYRRYGGQSPARTPLPSVPLDYDARLKRLRRRSRLTQDDLARALGPRTERWCISGNHANEHHHPSFGNAWRCWAVPRWKRSVGRFRRSNGRLNGSADSETLRDYHGRFRIEHVQHHLQRRGVDLGAS